jgi:hypothetical protein
MRILVAGAIVALLAILTALLTGASDEKTPVNDRQLSVMMFVDYGRSYGYQTMLARIRVATIKAELARDKALLKQKETLARRNAIPAIEVEIARLKDTWNRKQLVVAEKNLAYVSAEYDAMRQMAKHFAGVEVPAEALYATFRRGWEAGCDKGPDEVAAMKAWADFLAKSLERSRQLNSQGTEPLASVLEKEAKLKIAQANYEQRRAALDRCRDILFPGLQDVLAIEP